MKQDHSEVKRNFGFEKQKAMKTMVEPHPYRLTSLSKHTYYKSIIENQTTNIDFTSGFFKGLRWRLKTKIHNLHNNGTL